MKKFFLIFTLSVFLSACTAQPPKCSDDTTLSLVKKIFVEDLGHKTNLVEAERQNLVTITLPRASAFNEHIKKYDCEAQLIVGNNYQSPIRYTSQLDDKNQHIVSAATEIPLNMDFIESVKNSRATATAENIIGTWEDNQPDNGVAMKIKPSPAGYEASLTVGTPDGCTGDVKLSGSLHGNTLELTKEEDSKLCKISVRFFGSSASVEDHCPDAHGMGCSFNSTLQKMN